MAAKAATVDAHCAQSLKSPWRRIMSAGGDRETFKLSAFCERCRKPIGFATPTRPCLIGVLWIAIFDRCTAAAAFDSQNFVERKASGFCNGVGFLLDLPCLGLLADSESLVYLQLKLDEVGESLSRLKVRDTAVLLAGWQTWSSVLSVPLAMSALCEISLGLIRPTRAEVEKK